MLLEYTEQENINYMVAVDNTDFSQGNSRMQCVSLLKQGDIWDLTFGVWVWNWDHNGLEELRATYKEENCPLLKNQCSFFAVHFKLCSLLV